MNEIKTGLPGSHPVFILNGRLVLKFFTDLFGTPENVDIIEMETIGLLSRKNEVAVPELIAWGSLFEPGALWHWPYIVESVIPGLSFGEGEPHGYGEKASAARYAAGALRSFHSSPLGCGSALKPEWTSFTKLLEARKSAMGAIVSEFISDPLKESLLVRLSEMGTPCDGSQTPCLLHGDLNGDHVMGLRDEAGEWQFTGVIDFGDVKVGDPLYDLVPLHFGLFDADKALLRVFLDAYGPDERMTADFQRRAMDYTLLYEFDVLTCGLQRHPEWKGASNFDELSRFIWDVGAYD